MRQVKTRYGDWLPCVNCGKVRVVARANQKHSNYTGLCRPCLVEFNHTKQANRKIEERPQTKRSDGYLEIILPKTHWCVPMATKSRRSLLVHRLVMAEHLRRLLEPWELVHHLNGVKDDNGIENLKLTTRKTHHLTYEAGYKAATDFQTDLQKEIRLLRWELKQIRERIGV